MIAPSAVAPAAPTGGGLPWEEIRAAASTGAPLETIVRALRITESALSDAATLATLREELAAGHAIYELELRKTIRNRGLVSKRNAGSVNALSLQARNILEWDRQIPTQETEPDLGTARQRLRDLFVKLAQSRSEIEGRPVTPLELLHREAQADAGGPPQPSA